MQSNQKLKSLGSALLSAIIADNIPAARALLNANAETTWTTKYEGNSCLHVAIKNNNLDMVRLLIEHGADLTKGNTNQLTPIAYAATLKRWDIVTYIAKTKLTNSEDLSCYGSALLTAARYNQLECVRALLAAGAPTTWRDATTDQPTSGNRPLHFAVLNDNPEMIALLIKYGADLEVENNKGFTTATLASATNKWNIVEAIGKALTAEPLYEKFLKDSVILFNDLKINTVPNDKRAKSIHEFYKMHLQTLENLASTIDSKKDYQQNAFLYGLVSQMRDNLSRPISEADQRLLAELCKNKNEFADDVATLHIHAKAIAEFASEIALVLSAMKKTIDVTNWEYVAAFNRKKSGQPKHVKKLSNLFAPYEIKQCSVAEIMMLYQKSTEIILSVGQNSDRQQVTTNFYANQERALTTIPFGNVIAAAPAAVPAAIPKAAEKMQPAPATSTTARLYPVLNDMPSLIPAAVPKPLPNDVAPKTTSHEKEVLRLIAEAPKVPVNLTTSGQSVFQQPKATPVPKQEAKKAAVALVS